MNHVFYDEGGSERMLELIQENDECNQFYEEFISYFPEDAL